MRLNYYGLNKDVFSGIVAAGKLPLSIDAQLRALVELRVSQINGCVYCVWKHCQEARAAGEIQERLDCVAAWHESTFFSPRERAALGWAESVTLISETGAPDEDFQALGEHFSDKEIVDLTAIIALMNCLNRVAISFRRVPTKSDGAKAG